MTLFDNYIDVITKKNSPKFYSLPKIHKPLLTVRPILSSVDSPTNYLSTYITDILTNAYNNDNLYYIKDSLYVKTEFNTTLIPPNYVIASLDGFYLFSNVYLELVTRVIYT